MLAAAEDGYESDVSELNIEPLESGQYELDGVTDTPDSEFTVGQHTIAAPSGAAWAPGARAASDPGVAAADANHEDEWEHGQQTMAASPEETAARISAMVPSRASTDGFFERPRTLPTAAPLPADDDADDDGDEPIELDVDSLLVVEDDEP